MTTALLLSGGMDSIALAWWKRPDRLYTVDYGQLAAPAEIMASRAVAKELGIPHEILHFEGREYGSGDMAGARPDGHAPASDWWPYRNQMLITLVAMKAVAIKVDTLWLGTVASDNSHRDGTTEFIKRMSGLLEFQEGAMTVEAPAIELSTVELIRTSGIQRGTLAWAHSCHKADIPCCACRGCNKHLEVLQELDADVDLAR